MVVREFKGTWHIVVMDSGVTYVNELFPEGPRASKGACRGAVA